MRRVPFLGATLILAVTTAVTADAQTADARRRTDEFARQAYDVARGRSIEQIERNSPLKSHTVAPFEATNAAPGEKWEVHSLTYQGLYLEEVLSPQQRFFLVKMIVSSPSIKLPQGLAIGSNRRDVERILGASSERGLAAMTYIGNTERVVFHLVKDTVARVEFHFHLD
jgi:hypothetical protein